MTVDGWLAVLAAVIALAASQTTLDVTTRLSASSRRRVLRRTVSGALALGAGLWCLDLTGLLALGTQSWAETDITILLAAFAVAVLDLMGMLAVFAGSEPSISRILAGSTAAAAGISATYWTAVAAVGPARPAADIIRPLILSLTLAFAAFSSAFLLRYRVGPKPFWIRLTARAAATLLGAAALLLTPLAGWQGGTLEFGSFGQGPGAGRELLGAALGAAGLAILAITHLASCYERRLADRSAQSARELEEVRTRLQYLATHDSLTGLPNWLLFKERLAQALADSGRPERAIAVAVLDLDHFSSLNHSLGHGAGDWLLCEVARRVGSVLRPGDLLARLGGDEFVVLIDSLAARFDAETTTRNIVAELREPFPINGADVTVRPSIGVSVWPDDGRRVDDLLSHAEVAMTLAKERGGAVQFFQHGMTDSMHERLALENDLRRAMVAGEFELCFQPVMSASTGRIITAEALLRWRHPRRGVIGPSSFVPLAEETGLMIPLGEWVIREACRYGAAWRLGHGAGIRVAVNLSATQFRHQCLLEVIRSALAAASLDAHCLEIELTESAVMTNPEESAGVLKQLRRMGVTVAVDDFGTGYSSLSYLRRFPIDKLKIDRSFVRDLATSRTDESIVHAIISLAHSVGLQVVAEGVETEEQLRCVRALGCDHWQGYYCCEPQPAEAFGATLRAQLSGCAALGDGGLPVPRPAGAAPLP
ncbi:MAG TPA: EAL domain-containing protein [Steroidobacteraceae bacterium]|nr:EAL domain-containing protein [Steroidobacteraceae bacterium]